MKADVRKILSTMGEFARYPEHRQYLWYKFLRRIGYADPNPRWAGLRLPGQASPAHVATPTIGSPRSNDASPTMSSDGSARQSTPGRSGQDGRARVRDWLFETSPYEDFDPAQHPEDLQGWSGDNSVLVGAIEIVRPARVCEVGSWKGRSAINMANAAKALHIDTEIVCVDTWLGSVEHWLKDEPEWYESLRIRNGMPRLYFTFLANVIRAGATDVITPFPNTSENAAEAFRRMGIRFDLIYIDAAHEYEPARRDIAAYYDLLSDDGLLIGDDYIAWPGVTRAADEFVAERGLRMIGMPGKVVIPKGNKYANVTFS